MENIENLLVSYQVDRHDIIRWVSNSWAPFARLNGATRLEASIEGCSLWESVAGHTTREVYRQLLGRARAGHRVSFTYRCDSPGLRRFMQMTMTPVANDRVNFDSLTVRTESRVPSDLLDSAIARGDTLLEVCSWCKRLKVAGEWSEVEDAVARLGLFLAQPPPALTHGMCPDCFRRIMAEEDAVAAPDPGIT